jgi:group I intron endonuclease
MKIKCVYLIRNKINGKIYVGKTIDFKKRISQHKHTRNKSNISNSIAKHGWDNFEVSIIENGEELTNLELLEKEKKWIEHLNSDNREIGYNLYHRGDPTGYKHSGEARRNMSIAHIGKKHSAETIEKISKSHIGIQPTIATRKKLKIARQGRDFSFRKKPVNQIDENGNVIKMWDSATDAAKFFSGHGRNGSAITAVCKGRYTGKIFGFNWEYHLTKDSPLI